jgi:hypothetical protein
MLIASFPYAMIPTPTSTMLPHGKQPMVSNLLRNVARVLKARSAPACAAPSPQLARFGFSEVNDVS